MASPLGASPVRREDARFLTGHGAYLDDLPFPGALRAVVLRSPHPHARLLGIATEAARAVPGVAEVLTASDLAADGIGPLLPTAPANLEGARSVDAAFWVDHGEELEQRFNAWAAR